MQAVSVRDDIVTQCEAITTGESDLIANLANISALIFDQFEDINWAGFYLTRGERELVLGPFQGKVACVRIPFGQGVCGVAADSQTLQHVHDVHEFSGHIACDAASNAEVVAPIIVDGKTVGVLDIDSPSVGRFSAEDAEMFARIAAICATFNWNQA
ncbi:GAF domain-containing protein [Idiomarina sp.]|jgi:GAF domain-containing protein|uniref:GAF domain-containing protein n=1 Tax=Idiomarina sp. TaxID=1874361 RepID=UPI002E9EE3EF|nr:GAF domain-containing protein [Pseudomonadota bacterium]|tara:strand:- start:420 stop:890 length:471 start_codon:yes stop_codon:yes gene_type:complete